MTDRNPQEIVVHEKIPQSLNSERETVPGLTWRKVLLLGVERGVREYQVKMRKQFSRERRDR